MSYPTSDDISAALSYAAWRVEEVDLPLRGVGDPRAADSKLMAWALANDHVVFTHDLDFSVLLALCDITVGP